jgi:hypothetical protein
LESAKEAFRARNAHCHATQLAKNFVPFRHSHASLALDFLEDSGQTLAAVWRELQGAANCVQDPSQDVLDRLHGTIAFFELFDGWYVLAVGRILGIKGPEDTVN